MIKIRLNPIEKNQIYLKQTEHLNDFNDDKKESPGRLSYDVTKVGNSTSVGKIISSLMIKLNKSGIRSKDKTERFLIAAKRWESFAGKLNEMNFDRRVIDIFISWRNRMRRIVMSSETKFLVRRTAALRIQRFWKMYCIRHKFKRIINSIKTLKCQLKVNFLLRGNRKTGMMIAHFIDNYTKSNQNNLSLEEKSAMIIQRNYKRFKAYKKYDRKILIKTKTSMYEKLKKRQTDLMNKNKIKKKAVHIIER